MAASINGNTFLAVRMAAQVSLRLKFLDMLAGVCVQYLDTLAEHAAVGSLPISSPLSCPAGVPDRL